MSLKDVSAKISNYKCFGEEAQGFDTILPINLIIGRNNSGKSALLDLVDYCCAPKDLERLGHKGQHPKVVVSDVLKEGELRSVFSEGTSGGGIPGNHWEFGRHWIGKRLTWTIAVNGAPEFVSIDPPLELGNPTEFHQRIMQSKQRPFNGKTFKRLAADRDISAEKEDGALQIRPNGDGVTNAIRMYLNMANLPDSLIHDELLNDLNSIFQPDGRFTAVTARQQANKEWELFLKEASKGAIALSHTGSGLKTILLVLVFLHLVPHSEHSSLGNFLFGFEELENNLHPSLQRRLLLYLRAKAVERGCTFFVTTHSNVAIDLFANAS